jgi:hypothetical protein
VAESAFQARVIRKLKRMFPGCEILKNDSGYRQGILDITILWCDFLGDAGIQGPEKAKHQPNQDYFVKKFNEMGFAAFIWPEKRRRC